MTYGDVFMQIVAEVSGKPKENFAWMYEHIQRFPIGTDFDKELTDEEAEALLENLRKEKDSIRAWLIKGGFMDELGEPLGNA